MDPNPEQWKELIEVILNKKHFIFLDSAYQVSLPFSLSPLVDGVLIGRYLFQNG